MANIGNLKVLIGANIDPLLKDLKRAEANLRMTARNFQQVGDSLIKFSAPLVAVGAGSVKMAMDFESSLTKMRSLVGLTIDQVNELSPAIKQVAKDTGVSATQAADAMFFITSAGLRGKEAMDALEMSAKASAVGLGDVKTIADLVTSTMNAYGSEIMSAEKATNILTAAVREGKLEASELSGAMGAVLPLASSMGIRFEEVGAAFAAMSRTGTGASEAATQLRGIMTSLLKPSKQAEDALNGMGLSSEQLRQQIRDKGLLSVLQTLSDQFQGNDAAAAAVFGNVRALSGVLDLMGANAAGTVEIFQNMADTTGVLEEAFTKYSDTTEAKMQKAKQTFMVLAIDLGEKLLPAFEAIIVQVQKFADWIGKLDKEVIANAVKIAAWVAGIGIAFKAVGMVIGGIGSLIGTFKSLYTIVKIARASMIAFNAVLLANPIGLIVAGIAALIAIIVVAIKKYDQWGAAVMLLLGPLGWVINLVQSFRRNWDSVVQAFKTDGILAGLKRIGVVMLDAVLMPLQQLLELASKLPGIGNLAAKGAEKIEALRNKLNLITVKPEVIEKPAKEAASTLVKAFDPAEIAASIESNATKSIVTGVTEAAKKAEKQLVEPIQALGNNVFGNLFKNIDFRKGLAEPQQSGEVKSDTAPDMQARMQDMLTDSLARSMEAMKRFGETTAATREQVVESIDSMIDRLHVMADSGSLTAQMVETVGAQIMASAEQGAKGMKDLADSALNAGAKVVRSYIMQGVASAVSKALSSIPFPLNIAAGSMAGAAAGVLFNSLLNKIRAPKLAKGGLAYGPTMAMVGDNPGANVDPEVISPLSKLKSMLSTNVVVNLDGEFKLHGRDLWLAVQKQNQIQTRLGGV